MAPAGLEDACSVPAARSLAHARQRRAWNHNSQEASGPKASQSRPATPPSPAAISQLQLAAGEAEAAKDARRYRTEVSLEIPSDKLFPFVYLPEYRSKWDKSLQSYKLIETIDQDTFIYRSITHSYGFGMISPRDFVYMLHVKTYDGSLKTTNSEVEIHQLITSHWIQRRWGGRLLRTLIDKTPFFSFRNPEHSRLKVIVQVDLGGYLLPSVIDAVMPMSLINFVTDCKAGFKMLEPTAT
ncbi:stAR-related lipid transfer protein 6 [Vipera latastei]